MSDAGAKAHPELKTVAVVLAHPELFPGKEDASKGAFMNCPSGWGCETVNTNLVKDSAFNFAKAGFNVVDPGSSSGLDGAIAKASQRGEAWFGYYWQPTVNVSKYNLKKLDFATSFDQKHWDDCLVSEDCESPQRSSWTKSKVNTVVVTKFAQANPEVMEYLNKRTYSSAQVGPTLVYMDENQANGEDAAYEFLKANQDLWSAWVPADVAEKIKKAL